MWLKKPTLILVCSVILFLSTLTWAILEVNDRIVSHTRLKPPLICNESAGKNFRSGTTYVSDERRIDYNIFTCDYGVHWWAIIKVEKSQKWHVIGPAQEVYPGLLESLNDELHAEIELQEVQTFK